MGASGPPARDTCACLCCLRFRRANAAAVVISADASAAVPHPVTALALNRRKWTHLLHAFRVGVERVAKLAADAEVTAADDRPSGGSVSGDGDGDARERRERKKPRRPAQTTAKIGGG